MQISNKISPPATFFFLSTSHVIEKKLTQLASEGLSKKTSDEIAQSFKLAQGHYWSSRRAHVVFSHLTQEAIAEIMENFLATATESEIKNYLDLMIEALPEERLLEIAGLDNFKDASSLYKSHALIKDEILKKSENVLKNLLREFSIEAIYFFHHIMDLLIDATGLKDLGPEESFSFDSGMSRSAVYKLKFYGKLLTYPGTILALVSSYIKFQVVAIGVTTLAITALFAAIVVYQRFFKLVPKEHTGLENLTLKRLNDDKFVFRQLDVLNEINGAFQEGRGVLLVGEPGCGKSTLPMAMVDQMAEGSNFTFLKGAQFFKASAAKFKNISYGSGDFSCIEEKFKAHKNKVVFFFDEFHNFFKESGGLVGNNVGEELKTFCDEFKYILAATTTTEYKDFVEKQTAIIGRRFKVIHMNTLEDKKIKSILLQKLQSSHPEIELGEGVIKYIISKAGEYEPNTSIISGAEELLKNATSKITASNFPAIEKHIAEIETKINSLKLELPSAKGEQCSKLIAKIKGAQKEKKEFEMELESKKEQYSRIKKIENFYLDLKKQSYEMADPHRKLTSDSTEKGKWLQLCSQINLLKNYLVKEKEKLSIPGALDKQLIDAIFEEKEAAAI